MIESTCGWMMRRRGRRIALRIANDALLGVFVVMAVIGAVGVWMFFTRGETRLGGGYIAYEHAGEVSIVDRDYVRVVAPHVARWERAGRLIVGRLEPSRWDEGKRWREESFFVLDTESGEVAHCAGAEEARRAMEERGVREVEKITAALRE